MDKPFALFAGDSWYPAGGWNDFIDYYPSVEEASVRGAQEDWWHIVDLRAFVRVASGYREH